MYALTQTATHYRRTGQSGGKPAYAEEGQAFRCRSQPAGSRTTGGKGVDEGFEAKIFAGAEMADTGVTAGDKIVLQDGTECVVVDVQIMYGYAKAHHVEITTRRA